MNSMYSWIRNTHLALGLFCWLFLLMYGVSSLDMSHGGWFPHTETVTETSVNIDPEEAPTPRSLARQLRQDHGLRGNLQRIRQNRKRIALRIVRPGTRHDVTYRIGSDRASVRTNKGGFIEMINYLHHLAGLGHEYRLLNVWGFFVGFVSVALFGLGATGVYLWFKHYNERVIGVVLLGISLAYGLTLIVLVRVA